jgi:ribose 1,5-bisphosphate isomerase
MKEAAKRKKFNKICKDIKEIKIQGARNIAKAALEAHELIPGKSSIKKLKSIRPTEPMLVNVLNKLEREDYEKIKQHFDWAQEKINEAILDLIKDEDVIYTHCHSTNVIKSLINAKKKGKNFEVYNTETRPLFQGRKTAKELKAAGIKVTMFVDSAMDVALSNKDKKKKVTKIFLGADALINEGVINKIGSGAISKLGKVNKIPLYVVADSWKHSPKDIKIEERDFHEVWEKMPKKSEIKIRNPAFELIPVKNMKGIVTELGLMKYKKFLKVMKKN